MFTTLRRYVWLKRTSIAQRFFFCVISHTTGAALGMGSNHKPPGSCRTFGGSEVDAMKHTSYHSFHKSWLCCNWIHRIMNLVLHTFIPCFSLIWSQWFHPGIALDVKKPEFHACVHQKRRLQRRPTFRKSNKNRIKWIKPFRSVFLFYFFGVINQLSMKLHGGSHLVAFCGIWLPRKRCGSQGSWVSTWRTGARRRSAMLRWSLRRAKGWAVATVAMSHLAKSFLRCCLAPFGGHDTAWSGWRAKGCQSHRSVNIATARLVWSSIGCKQLK